MVFKQGNREAFYYNLLNNNRTDISFNCITCSQSRLPDFDFCTRYSFSNTPAKECERRNIHGYFVCFLVALVFVSLAHVGVFHQHEHVRHYLLICISAKNKSRQSVVNTLLSINNSSWAVSFYMRHLYPKTTLSMKQSEYLGTRHPANAHTQIFRQNCTSVQKVCNFILINI